MMVTLQRQIKRVKTRFCPCCSHPLLRQIRNQKISWFCKKCWQEMPLLEEITCRKGLKNLTYRQC